MYVNVSEAARLLVTDSETIYRWIDKAELPVHYVNEEYRFNKSELLEWATAKGFKVAADLFARDRDDMRAASVGEALSRGTVLYDVAGNSKEAALRGIIDAISLPATIDRDFLYQIILARELLGSTAIGHGVAVPHVRNPLVLRVEESSAHLAFLRTPIDFDALDGEPVDTVFILISPSVQTHLQLLSKLSLLLRNDGLVRRLKARAPRGELLEFFGNTEQELVRIK